jgi:hypothetical protein
LFAIDSFRFPAFSIDENFLRLQLSRVSTPTLLSCVHAENYDTKNND